MPIYEYRCSACGFQKEYLQKVSDPLLTRCPECGKESLSKMLTAPGFQLKGSGWYATDFKNSGARPAKSDAKEKSGGKDKSDNKSEGSKPDGNKPDGSKSESKAAAACGSGACPSCS